MRRHLPVLTHAFRFYAAWVASLTTLSSVAVLGALAAAGEWQIGLAAAILGGVVGLAIATPFWWTARGLQGRREWARVLGVALSMLVITDIPFGLGLGLLGLGTLLDGDVAREFRGEPAQLATTDALAELEADHDALVRQLAAVRRVERA
jgi:hypothetical protein